MKKIIYTCLTCILILVTVCSSKAQTDLQSQIDYSKLIIEVDTNLQITLRNLPFDKAFYLRWLLPKTVTHVDFGLIYNQKDLRNINAIDRGEKKIESSRKKLDDDQENKLNRLEENHKERMENHKGRIHADTITIVRQYFSTAIVNAKEYYVVFGRVPALPPSAHWAIVLYAKTGDLNTKLFTIARKINDNPNANLKDDFGKLFPTTGVPVVIRHKYLLSKKSAEAERTVIIQVDTPSYTDFHQFVINNLNVEITNLKDSESKLKIAKDRFQTRSDLSADTIFRLSITGNSAAETAWMKLISESFKASNALLMFSDKNLQSLNQLKQEWSNCYQLSKTDSKNIASGLVSFPFNPITKISKTISWDTRVVNVDSTKSHLNELQNWILRINIPNDVNLKMLADTVGNALFAMKKIALELDALKADSDMCSKNIGIIKDKINTHVGDNKTIACAPLPLEFDGTTATYNFDTRGKLYLRNEFGLAFYSNFKNHDSAFSNLEPFIGFRFSPTYFDPDIPLNSYHKTILQRFSFNFALGLTDVVNQTEGRKSLWSKYPVLVGIGFRLTNFVETTAGVMLFLKDDPSPLVTNYSIAAVPFSGISFDFSINNAITAISNVFKLP